MKKELTFIIFTLGLAIGASAAPIFTAITDNPTNNMFVVGRPVPITFMASGWQPNEARQVVAEVFDYQDKKMSTLTAELKADATGAGSVKVMAPGDKFGFYRVRAKAGDLALPKLGSRPAGQITYGIAMNPKARPVIPQERAFMGIHGEACYQGRWMGAHQGFAAYSFNKEAADKALATRIATGNNLDQWGFCFVFPSSGRTYDFVTWNNKGLMSPKSEEWVRKNYKGLPWNAFTTPDGREFYREWIQIHVDALRKFPRTPGKRIYQIFAEPDLSVPDKKTLVAAAEFAHKVIKEIDPEGLIALPTLSNCSLLSWHRELFELGILKYADVFDIHPYTAFPPEPNGFVDNIRALKRMLAEYGRADLPMIGTEGGFQTEATLDGEKLQAEGLVRKQLIMLGEGYWFNCPFYGTDYGGDRDDHPEGDYGITYNLNYPKPRFGAKQISPRPAFAALCSFSMMVDGSRPQECIDCLDPTTLGYVYTNSACTVAALWDYDGVPVQVSLPVGKAEIVVADMMGNRTTYKTKDGMLQLELTTAPVYILDPDMTAWQKGMAGLRAAAMERERVKQMAPVKVLRANAAFVNGCAAAAVTVLNNTAAACELEVATRIVGQPDARRAIKQKFAPHEEKVVLVPLKDFRPSPFEVFTLQATARDAAGHRVEAQAAVNFLAAEYVPGVGKTTNLAQWQGLARHKLPRVAAQNDIASADAFKDENDLRVEIGFGWNEEALLIDARVCDDAYRNEKTGWWTWSGDAIQFGLAKARLEKLTGNDYTDSLSQGTTEIDFALTKNGPEGYRTISFDPYKWPTDMHGKGQIDPKDCNMSIIKTPLAKGVELRYRIALPWRYINKTTAAAGEQVFVSATFNDCDPGDKNYNALKMFELKRMAPRHFGALYLNPKAK